MRAILNAGQKRGNFTAVRRRALYLDLRPRYRKRSDPAMNINVITAAGDKR
jgi:hypothetical protein